MATSSIRARVLVVDDEPIIRSTIAEFLESEGLEVATCANGRDALGMAENGKFDVILCDVQLPDLDGVEVLDRLRAIAPSSFVLLITAYASVETAVEAFQRGAQDYLMKPILLDEVLAKIRRLLAVRDVQLENQWLRRQIGKPMEPDQIVGTSTAMQKVLAMARKVAAARSNVLLVGESGTGKELIARMIHDQAGGAGPFLAVNCAAIPHDLLENQLFGHRRGAFTGADRDQPGVFAHAGSGTVFLDEIAELPLSMQAKLLRAIEQKEVMPVGANEPVRVDARILAATNKDLKKEVEGGRFREDLYYRLNVVTIEIPPLRDRREDIPPLVESLLSRHTHSMGKRVLGVTHEAMQLLRAHPWKGNVRELDNVLQRAVILGDSQWIGPADLPSDLTPADTGPIDVDDLGQAVRLFERRHIERVLQRVPDKKEAARLLGMGLSSLYRKISELGIAGD